MKWPWKKKPDGALTVKTVSVSETIVTANAEQANNARMDGRGKVPAGHLTPREREVFELLIKGRKMREVAEELGIKYSTVNTHQKSVYKKLGVNSRAECILRYASLEKNVQ